MVDFEGQELHVGDEVIYIKKTVGGQSGRLAKGRIESFYNANTAVIADSWKGSYASDPNVRPAYGDEKYFKVRVKSVSIKKL